MIMKKTAHYPRLHGGFFCCVLLLTMALSPIAAQEKTNDQFYPYTLGAGMEMNQNTRSNFAMNYGAAIDRFVAYNKNGGGMILAGLKGYMITDLFSITGAEADIYVRLNLFNLGPGVVFTQLGWGYADYREEEIYAQTMLADFTIGYRVFFANGFYAEPYFRTGFPLRMGFGIMAGHRFAF
jgi:hypothetical protein